MARIALSNVRGMGDFASVYRWTVTMVAPAKVSGFSFDGMDLRCETTEIPKATNSKIEVNVRGHKIHRPGTLSYNGTLQLTFIETVDNKVHNFLRTWREAIWSTGIGVQSGTAAELQGSLLLTRLDNTDKPIWEYKLEGVWLEDYDFGQLDGSQNEFMKPSMTVSYDFFEDKAL